MKNGFVSVNEIRRLTKGQYNLVQIFEKMSCIRKTEIFQYDIGGSETSWGRVQGDRFRLNLKKFLTELCKGFFGMFRVTSPWMC